MLKYYSITYLLNYYTVCYSLKYVVSDLLKYTVSYFLKYIVSHFLKYYTASYFLKYNIVSYLLTLLLSTSICYLLCYLELLNFLQAKTFCIVIFLRNNFKTLFFNIMNNINLKFCLKLKKKKKIFNVTMTFNSLQHFCFFLTAKYVVFFNIYLKSVVHIHWEALQLSRCRNEYLTPSRTLRMERKLFLYDISCVLLWNDQGGF